MPGPAGVGCLGHVSARWGLVAQQSAGRGRDTCVPGPAWRSAAAKSSPLAGAAPAFLKSRNFCRLVTGKRDAPGRQTKSHKPLPLPATGAGRSPCPVPDVFLSHTPTRRGRGGSLPHAVSHPRSSLRKSGHSSAGTQKTASLLTATGVARGNHRRFRPTGASGFSAFLRVCFQCLVVRGSACAVTRYLLEDHGRGLLWQIRPCLTAAARGPDHAREGQAHGLPLPREGGILGVPSLSHRRTVGVSLLWTFPHFDGATSWSDSLRTRSESRICV